MSNPRRDAAAWTNVGERNNLAPREAERSRLRLLACCSMLNWMERTGAPPIEVASGHTMIYEVLHRTVRP